MTHAHQLQFSQLESMVSKPTWKGILLDLVASSSFDPWNVDIMEISDAFMKRVREMEQLDFGVQANVILAAAILLRYKSNYLAYLKGQPDLTDYIPEEQDVFPADDQIPQLALAGRIPPKRQFTVEELIQEMERIIKYENMVLMPKPPRGAIVETVDMELREHDIETDMRRIKARIDANTDGEGWSLFSVLVKGAGFEETVYTLLCILHLVQNREIDIRQDVMYGEIFISQIRR